MIIQRISLSKAAEECGISRPTLYNYIKLGKVPDRKTPGGKPFLRREDVDNLKRDLEYGEGEAFSSLRSENAEDIKDE